MHDDSEILLTNRRIFKAFQKIYKDKPEKLVECALKEESEFASVFLKNLEMFEADYDDDNADEYACMHADGLLEDLCPGWNLT